MIDTSLPIIFNGHTSAPIPRPAGGGPVSGCEIKSIAPSISVDIAIVKKALADGVSVSDAYFGGQTYRIAAEIYGRTPEETEDNVAAFEAAYSPRSPSLLVSAPFQSSRRTANTTDWPTGKIPLYMTATPILQPTVSPTTRRDQATGAHIKDVLATLLAPDPYQYIDSSGYTSGSRQIVPLATSFTSLPYRGNAPCSIPEVWIALSSTPGPVITVGIQGPYGRIDGGYSLISIDTSGFTTGVTYNLSFADKCIYANGVPVAGAITGAIFGAIIPGAEAKYVVTSGSGSKLSYVKLLYDEAFF